MVSMVRRVTKRLVLGAALAGFLIGGLGTNGGLVNYGRTALAAEQSDTRGLLEQVPINYQPVVIRTGWGGFNIYFNKNETRRNAAIISRPTPQRIALFLNDICGVLQNRGLTDTCKRYAGYQIPDATNAFRSAARDGICVKYWYSVVSPLMLSRWSRYNGSHCH